MIQLVNTSLIIKRYTGTVFDVKIYSISNVIIDIVDVGAASSSVTTKETLLAVMRTSGARLGGRWGTML